MRVKQCKNEKQEATVVIPGKLPSGKESMATNSTFFPTNQQDLLQLSLALSKKSPHPAHFLYNSLPCFSSLHKIFLLPLASSRFFFFFLWSLLPKTSFSHCSALSSTPLKSFSQLFSHGFQTPLPRCLSLPLMLCFRSRNLAAQAYSPIVSESSWYVSPIGSFKKRSLLQPTISYTCCQNFLKCSKNVVQNTPQTKRWGSTTSFIQIQLLFIYIILRFI